MTSLQGGTRGPARFEAAEKEGQHDRSGLFEQFGRPPCFSLCNRCVSCTLSRPTTYTDLDLVHGLARRLALSSHFSRRDICLPEVAKLRAVLNAIDEALNAMRNGAQVVSLLSSYRGGLGLLLKNNPMQSMAPDVRSGLHP